MSALQLCYVTDRRAFPGDQSSQRASLLKTVSAAAQAGVDFIQLREKDLSSADLESLAADCLGAISACASSTRLMINSRADVACATGSDGVHLRSADISVPSVRAFCNARGFSHAQLSVSCHRSEEVKAASQSGADFIVFGPIFEKGSQPGVGLEALREACQVSRIPVFAIGGVSGRNAAACRAAGAAGIAAIRLFQQEGFTTLVKQLKSL